MKLKKCCLFLGIVLFGENGRERKTLLGSFSFSQLNSHSTPRQQNITQYNETDKLRD